MTLNLVILRSQLDTLETDAGMSVGHDATCDACQETFFIKIVMLGSRGDRELNRRQAAPLAWHVGRVARVLRMLRYPLAFVGALGSMGTAAKTIRVRLTPKILFQLRNRFSVACTAHCPHCHTPISLTLQPA